ncbi:MAG TPA: ABC transporter ATP-binding protein [Gemmatimonadales bacterium]|nr:ABC transporter ATP-binding protein [Gemmatimonadales bacterium]
MTLTAVEISARYPGQDGLVLHAVNARVERGEFVVVAGPNGSGKSTLVRALLGLHPVERGSVTLDGRPLAERSRAEIAREVAALPQREEPAFPLAVTDAVMLGRWAALGPFAAPGARDHDAVTRALQACRLESLADRTTDTLSGGEWQRVRLARALAAEPRLLLLDEPGTALDIAHEMALYELLAEQVAHGRGVLAVTHHLNAALRYADRVLLLDHGRVIVDGRPADVLSTAVLSRVFDWPIALGRLDDGAPHLVPRRRSPPPQTPPLSGSDTRS